MTEKLNKYLEIKANYEIFKFWKQYKNSDETIEKYLDYLHSWCNHIIKNMQSPLEINDKIKAHINIKPDFNAKSNFLQNILSILETYKSDAWQLNEIKSLINSQLKALNYDKALKEQTQLFNGVKKMISDAINKTKPKSTIDRKNFILFKFITDKKDLSGIIESLYKLLLKHEYIRNDYEPFKNHFIFNNTEIEKIIWTGKKYELKAFIDLLINESIIKDVGPNNKFIVSHFTGDDFSVDSQSMRSVNTDESYKKIRFDKPEEHPIVQIINAIKKQL